jgi:hypothetical protein
MITPKIEHSSSNWCQSRLLRASREASRRHQAGLAQTDLSDQTLEALPLSAGGARLAQIIIDHGDPLARPTEAASPIDQTILEFRALLMLANLARGGLADIDVCELGPMGRAHPFSRLIQRAQHGWPPRLERGEAPGRIVATTACAWLPAAPAMVVDVIGEGSSAAAAGDEPVGGEWTWQTSSLEEASMLRM